MIELTVEKIELMNQGCLKEGEPFGVLDMNRLQSALSNQYNGYLYGTDLQAAVSTFKSIILNHPFRNGNKRTALLSLLYFTKDLNETIKLSHQEITDLVYEIASEGGSQISVNSLTNRLFGTNLEESLVNNLNEKVEKHDILNPKLWNEDNTLKAEVEEKINMIVDDFLHGLEEDDIKFKLDDIKLVGSNASYNWNDKSDLDLHLVMDLSIYDDLEKKEMAELLYNYAKSLWNKNYVVYFRGIPVEIFVETNNTIDMN